MSDLREIVEKQEAEDVQPVWKFKVIAILSIVLVLYITYCCVFQQFKVFVFMNNVVDFVLSFLNKIVLFFSKTVKTILSWF